MMDQKWRLHNVQPGRLRRKPKLSVIKPLGEIDLFSAVNREEKVNNLGILAAEKLDNLLLRHPVVAQKNIQSCSP